MVNAANVSALPGDGGARTTAELLAEITSTPGPVAAVHWQDGKLLATMLNQLVEEGFVMRLAGDEVRYRLLRAPTAADFVRLDAELIAEMEARE